MLINLRDPWHFWFSTIPEKDGKLSKICENKDDVVGLYLFIMSDSDPHGIFLITYYLQQDLTMGAFYKYSRFKNENFC